MSKDNKQPEKKKPIKRKNSEDSTEGQKLEMEDKGKIFKAKKKLKSMENKNLEITNEIEIEKENIMYNTPVIITYKNCKFKINTRKYYELYESTWKCNYYRRKKDLPQDIKIFCNATIKGVRDAFFKDRYKLFLIENHSELCNNLNKSNIKKNSDIYEDIKKKKKKRNLKKTKIIHLKQMKKKLSRSLRKMHDSRTGKNPEIWESYPRLRGPMRSFQEEK